MYLLLMRGQVLGITLSSIHIIGAELSLVQKPNHQSSQHSRAISVSSRIISSREIHGLDDQRLIDETLVE